MSANRTLLLLGAGMEQIEAIRVARELGYRTVAFDHDGEAAGRTHCDAFFQVDLKNPEALLGHAESVSPDGVFVHAAELAVEAARVADAFGLPGLSIDVADRATDKSRRIATLDAAGLRTPRFKILDAAAPLHEWTLLVESLPYPLVLKPTDQAGARGVERISHREELADYYQRRTEFSCPRFVCEELLDGVQLSTESVASQGKVLHHAIALRHYDTTQQYAPFFIEDGHSMPFEMSGEQEAAVHAVIERCFAALEVHDGVLKGDLLLSASGEIFVLEMAVRTSGGRFADTVVPLSTGVHILYPLIEMAMGDAYSRDWFTPTRNAGVSQRFFLHEGAGSVRRWPPIRDWVARPGVHDCRLNESQFRSGELPRIRSHRDRFGYVICTGETREDADRIAQEVTAPFNVEVGLDSNAEPSSR